MYGWANVVVRDVWMGKCCGDGTCGWANVVVTGRVDGQCCGDGMCEWANVVDDLGAR